MRYIKLRNHNTPIKINESKVRGTSSVISDLCTCMLLINPNFLDNILDLGMKGRYVSNSSIFLNDLKNLVIGKNRLKIGKWVEDECVEDTEEGRINSIFNEFTNDFNIEEDWTKLVNSRVLARNIQDKLFLGEKLLPEMISNVYWTAPNKTDDHPEDIVVVTTDNKIYPLNINKKMNLTKTISFNTILDTILDDNLLYSESYLPKWDKLCQEWCRLIYENCKPEYKSYIKKFVNPERFPSITYFGFFQIKHMDQNVQNLGEFFKEFNKNILELSELLGLIYKNAQICLIDPEKIIAEWNEKKTTMLNSHIIEHLLIESFKSMSTEQLVKSEDGKITSDGKTKMKLTRLILDLIGSTENDTYYFSNNGNILYRIPERQFFRDNYDKIKVTFDIHTQLIQDEDSDASQLKLVFSFNDSVLLNIEINTNFGTLEMNGKLSSKFKLNFESDFNYQLVGEIEKIEEKLSDDVYNSAASKLTSKGHYDRGKQIRNYISKVKPIKPKLVSETLFKFSIGDEENTYEDIDCYITNIRLDIDEDSEEFMIFYDIVDKFYGNLSGELAYMKIYYNYDTLEFLSFFQGSELYFKLNDRKQAIEVKRLTMEYLNSEEISNTIDEFADNHDRGPEIKYNFIDLINKISINDLYK